MIEPHGGRLVRRLVSGEKAAVLEEEARELPVIQLNPFELSDLEMLAIGAFSPLEGFMTSADYAHVINDKRLANSLPWTLPITLAVDKEKAESLKNSSRAALADSNGTLLAVLDIQDVFQYDREAESVAVFRTANNDHPGARYVASRGDWIVGGPVEVFRRPNSEAHSKYRLDPADTRRIFAERGWNTVVGFQTRNPVHRAHEYIQKAALEIVDGLLLHPIAGETKSDDISLEVRLRCYEVLLENYYPRDRALLVLDHTWANRIATGTKTATATAIAAATRVYPRPGTVEVELRDISPFLLLPRVVLLGRATPTGAQYPTFGAGWSGPRMRIVGTHSGAAVATNCVRSITARI